MAPATPARGLALAVLALLASACLSSVPPATKSASPPGHGEPPPITRAVRGQAGQPVSNGRIEVVVAPVIQGFSLIGDERVAAGLVFDVIEVTVRNISAEAVPVGPGSLTQGISDFRCYPDQPPPAALRDPFPALTLAPGESARGSLVFDNERQLTSRYLAYDDGKAIPILVELRQATRRFSERYPGGS